MQVSAGTLVKDAYRYAAEAHAGQARKDGTPYFGHPAAVAEALWEKWGDPALAAAALLHDVPEDCPDRPVAGIYARFGREVGFLVDAATKEPLSFHGEPRAWADPVEKLLAGASKDPRCLLLKIADRDHNLSTAAALAPHRQARMAFETQAVYEPIRALFAGARDAAACASSYRAWEEGRGAGGPAAAKAALLSTFFEGLGSDGLEAVMRRAAGVTWVVTDRAAFRRLFASPDARSKVRVASMSMSASGGFECSFAMVGAHVQGPGPDRVSLGRDASSSYN